jgi:hypothetical protein
MTESKEFKMLSEPQLEKCNQFIYRHGRLLERKRYAYHFEGGSRQAVLDVLACHQNADGGFGHGLELDVMCPQSSPICTEVGLAILIECDACDSAMTDRAEAWIVASQREDGKLAHPEDAVRAYPHGEWWLGDDDIRVFSLAGLLGKLGRGTEEFYARVAALFRATYSPFPAEIGVYMYPLHLYLSYAPGADQFAAERIALRGLIPNMLAREAWHCPLFFCHDRWHSEDITDDVWREEARKAVSTLEDDGGVSIAKYAKMPWWRPVWTLEMLVRLRRQRLLKTTGEPGVAGDA